MSDLVTYNILFEDILSSSSSVYSVQCTVQITYLSLVNTTELFQRCRESGQVDIKVPLGVLQILGNNPWHDFDLEIFHR